MGYGTPDTDKEGTFNLMQARGITRAIVAFSGGNDEGGADSISVLREGAEDESDLPLYGASQADEELAELLARPVYDSYGSFAGEFSVSGIVTWDLAERTVKMTGEESNYEPMGQEF